MSVEGRHPVVEWDRTLAVDLRGPWFSTRRARAGADRRPAAGLDRLHVLAPGHVRLRWPHTDSATEAAATMLVKELAWELAHDCVRVNAIVPGDVPTGWGAHEAGVRSRIATGRTGAPDGIAGAALALLEEESCGNLTGARIPVDGDLGLFDWLHDPRC